MVGKHKNAHNTIKKQKSTKSKRHN